MRNASDAAWSGRYVYGGRATFGQKIVAAFVAVGRMIAPVAALLVAIAGLYLYRDTLVPLLSDGAKEWLTIGHLLVPVGFLCVHLTNRRYGPAYAFAQVVIASVLVVVLVVFAGDKLRPFLPQDGLPTLREALGFGGAFFVASFISIAMFDGARGRYWWPAPVFGFLSAAIFFAPIFYPAAYAGIDALWLMHSLKYLGVLAGEGILMLIPYWMLRGSIPPLPGFGGY